MGHHRSNFLDDSSIRFALRSRLVDDQSDKGDTVIIEELGLCRGRVRVDMAVVNGYIHGYEIKSDRDRLSRLPVQSEIYTKVLDRAFLVGDRHLEEGVEIVPSWWGILRAYPTADGIRFKTVRRGRQNPKRDARSIVELLWLDDAISLLESRDAARGYRGKPRSVVWDRVCKYFSVDEIADAVRMKLKARAAIQALR